MTCENRTSTDPTWFGKASVDDAALTVADIGGPGVPVVSS